MTASSAQQFGYSVLGMQIKSEIELPEAVMPFPVADMADDALAISIGEVSAHLPGSFQIWPYLDCTDTAALYRIDGIGRFLIENGTRIVVDPAPDVPIYDVRNYLLGLGLGTAMHQRHLVPLHVGVTLSPQGLVAVTGHSGSGKSTLTAVLHHTLGWPILADDIAVLDMGSGSAQLFGGLARLKLWEDALDLVPIDRKKLMPDFSRANKFHAQLDQGAIAGPAPLRALIQLDRDEAVDLLPCTGIDRFQIFADALYRPEMLDLFGNRGQTFSQLGKAQAATEVKRLTRPWDTSRMQDVVTILHRTFK